jgi:hypothetical protein
MPTFRPLLCLTLFSALTLTPPLQAAESFDSLSDFVYTLHKYLLAPPSPTALLAAINRWQSVAVEPAEIAARQAYLKDGIASHFTLACPTQEKTAAPMRAQQLEILEHRAATDSHHYKVRLQLMPQGSSSASCSETYDLTLTKAQHPSIHNWEWLVSELNSSTRRQWLLKPKQPQTAAQLQNLAQQLKLRLNGPRASETPAYGVSIQAGNLLVSHALSRSQPENWSRWLTIPGQIRFKYRASASQLWVDAGLGNADIADVRTELQPTESIAETLTNRYNGKPSAKTEAWTVELTMTLMGSPKLLALTSRPEAKEWGLFLDQALLHSFSLSPESVQEGLLTLGFFEQQKAQELVWALGLQPLSVGLTLVSSQLEKAESR